MILSFKKNETTLTIFLFNFFILKLNNIYLCKVIFYKMAGKKATSVDKQTIISHYMNYVLEHESYPKSVYKFCKEIKIKEEEFYKFFGNIEKLKNSIWSEFYKNTTGVMFANKEYDNYSNREKMLTFFYTFFELLTMKRSFVLFKRKYRRS